MRGVDARLRLREILRARAAFVHGELWLKAVDVNIVGINAQPKFASLKSCLQPYRQQHQWDRRSRRLEETAGGGERRAVWDIRKIRRRDRQAARGVEPGIAHRRRIRNCDLVPGPDHVCVYSSDTLIE